MCNKMVVSIAVGFLLNNKKENVKSGAFSYWVSYSRGRNTANKIWEGMNNVLYWALRNPI